MESFDKMLQQFKDFSSLQTYAEAQYKTIVSLSKKIKALEEENVELKDLLDSSVPTVVQSENGLTLQNVEASSDEEMIAKVQLARLNEISMSRELTLEEAKRVEIFTKILTVKGNNNSIAIQTKKLDNDDLLKFLNNETA